MQSMQEVNTPGYGTLHQVYTVTIVMIAMIKAIITVRFAMGNTCFTQIGQMLKFLSLFFTIPDMIT